MLILHDVTTGYGKKVIAQHLNANLRRGELVALLGPNGCGKSTFSRWLYYVINKKALLMKGLLNEFKS